MRCAIWASKEIEIGFPSASETEYEICRELIEGGISPTTYPFRCSSGKGASYPQNIRRYQGRKKRHRPLLLTPPLRFSARSLFKKDMAGITEIAVNGAKLIKELTDNYSGDTNIRFEYSPESFSGTRA